MRARRRIRNEKLLYTSIYTFDIETHGAKSVVAGNHCGTGIFHPAVKKVSSPVCKLLHEGFYAIPRTVAKSARLLCARGNVLVPHAQVAGVFDGVFVYCGKVFMLRFSDNSDFDVFHILSPKTV